MFSARSQDSFHCPQHWHDFQYSHDYHDPALYPESSQRTVITDPQNHYDAWAPPLQPYSPPYSAPSYNIVTFPTPADALAASYAHAAAVASTQRPASAPVYPPSSYASSSSSSSAPYSPTPPAYPSPVSSYLPSPTVPAASPPRDPTPPAPAPIVPPSRPRRPPPKSTSPPPALHTFHLSTLEPVRVADDPFPLALADLTTTADDAPYAGLASHFTLSLSPHSHTASPTPTPPPRTPPPAASPAAAARRAGKVKMHACALCAKAFPRPSGLRTHMNSHSGDKPFKCPIAACAKSFTVRSNAKRHLRTHGVLPPNAAQAPNAPPRPRPIRWVGQGDDSDQDDPDEDEDDGSATTAEH